MLYSINNFLIHLLNGYAFRRVPFEPYVIRAHSYYTATKLSFKIFCSLLFYHAAKVIYNLLFLSLYTFTQNTRSKDRVGWIYFPIFSCHRFVHLYYIIFKKNYRFALLISTVNNQLSSVCLSLISNNLYKDFYEWKYSLRTLFILNACNVEH